MNTHNRGFTLIIAVLISSIVLSIGLSMFNISIKQSILSSTARESQAAFFAADSGIECASYWEYKTPSEFDPGLATITCNNQSIGVTHPAASGNDPLGVPYIEASQFTLPLGGASAPCAVVTVQKSVTPSTQIESRGYNTCDANDPRRTERGIRITQ